MDSEPLDDNVACAGYGAITVILRLLSSQLGILSAHIRQGDYTGIDAFLSTADGMVAALGSIVPTPDWDDARIQLLAVIRQYREMVEHAATKDRSLIDSSLAEVLEAIAILTIARDRLAGRLGFTDS